MSSEVIAKIKPKNNGAFKIADAVDINGIALSWNDPVNSICDDVTDMGTLSAGQRFIIKNVTDFDLFLDLDIYGREAVLQDDDILLWNGTGFLLVRHASDGCITFVLDEKCLYYFTDGEWTLFEGAQGPAGAVGPAGPQGEQGEPGEDGLMEIIEVTYADLTDLIGNELLVSGQQYIITDYQTIHTIPSTTDTNTGSTEPLKVKANGVDTLEAQAYSALYPQDVIYYDVNNDQTMVPGCSKGYIYRRVDVKQNNDFPFDFRNVKFRRWQIDVDAWDGDTPYEIGVVVHRTTGTADQQKEVYVSLKNGNEGNAVTDGYWWRRFEFDNGSYVSPTVGEWNRSDDYTFAIPCSGLYVDYKFFAEDGFYVNAINNKIDTPLSNLTGNNNSVVFGAGFFSNTIGSNFYFNSIGENFNQNQIGKYFFQNSTGENFMLNIIDENFSHNSIGMSFTSNKTGKDFTYNLTGVSFYFNQIGAGFSGNITGSGFSRNVIASYFFMNQTGSFFYFNNIGANFNGNLIKNTFHNNRGTCEDIDFTEATHVYEDYSCELLKNTDGADVLQYIDGDGFIHVVDLTTNLELSTTAKIIEVTFAQMEVMINYETLVPGQEYIITDYQTIHTIPNTEDTNTGDTEPLKVKANGISTLEAVAYSALFPNDVIYYNVYNYQTMVPGCTKGYIYRRVDTKQNNDFPFDFRNAKFRRWQISVDEWDGDTPYDIGAFVHRTTGTANQQKEVYVSLKNANEDHAVTDGYWWKRFEFDNLTYISPTEGIWDRTMEFPFIIPCSSLNNDYKFFAVDSYYETAFNNKIGQPDNDLIGSNNTVIFGISFQNNSIGANFQNNSIGAFFQNNSIGKNFQSNSIGNYFNSNFIEFEFGFNSINENFNSNFIRSLFSTNLIGPSFYTNIVNHFFYANFIGTDFCYNSIGTNFSYNSIGASFQNNSGTCQSIDFSLATHVYEDYNCELMKDNTGAAVLMYVDDGTITVVAADS